MKLITYFSLLLISARAFSGVLIEDERAKIIYDLLPTDEKTALKPVNSEQKMYIKIFAEKVFCSKTLSEEDTSYRCRIITEDDQKTCIIDDKDAQALFEALGSEIRWINKRNATIIQKSIGPISCQETNSLDEGSFYKCIITL